MQISPQIHVIDGIVSPPSGWKFLLNPHPRRTSTSWQHKRYSLYKPALLIDNESLTLLEAGTPESFSNFKTCIESLGFTLKNLKSIIICHDAADHIGELKHLVEESGAKVYAHELAVPWLLKKMPFEMYSRDFEVTNIDFKLKDGDILPVLGGLEIIHIPGHSQGHIAVYIKRDKVLFATDLIRYSSGEFHLTPPQYSKGYVSHIKSMIKVAKYDFDTLLVYHGEPLIGNAGNKYREFIEYLKAISDIFMPEYKEALAPETEG